MGRGTQGIFLLDLEGEMPLHPQSWNQKDVSWKRPEVLFSLLWKKPPTLGLNEAGTPKETQSWGKGKSERERETYDHDEVPNLRT